MPDAHVATLEESDTRSRYLVTSHDGSRRMGVAFVVEAEKHHFSVALASMTAKLARELLMARFNRYWSGLAAELKPTAGYATDARRWLLDARRAIAGFDERPLVRIV
jgi:ribonuclease HII